MPINTTREKQSMMGRMSLGVGKQGTETRSRGASLLARPTEASVATGSVVLKGPIKPKRKELTFKQQLLKKTLKDSVMRPSGVLALHIKQGQFHDIDSGGKVYVCSGVCDNRSRV